MSADKKCGTCHHFEPDHGPTGRVRPTKPGRCTWEHPDAAALIPVPGIPEWGGRFRTVGSATRVKRAVWRDCGWACPCWKEKT